MAGGDVSKYAQIIDLPHHTSETRPRMPLLNRAAQFAPFAALHGFEEEIEETARRTEPKKERSEEEKARLDAALRALRARLEERPRIVLTWFRRDRKKCGGAYVTQAVVLQNVDALNGVLVLEDGRRIPLDDIWEIRTELD